MLPLNEGTNGAGDAVRNSTGDSTPESEASERSKLLWLSRFFTASIFLSFAPQSTLFLRDGPSLNLSRGRLVYDCLRIELSNRLKTYYAVAVSPPYRLFELWR
jgi:hypothetical protein